MNESQPTEFQPAARHRLLVRGESLIGSIGLATAAILLGMIALAGWWAGRSQVEAWRFVRSEQVRVLGDVLSQSAESMIAGDELSSLRRLLIDTKHHHELFECSVVLPDGRVLAHSDPAKITQVQLPPQWPNGPVDAAETSGGGEEELNLSIPLLVHGRGAATLHLRAPIATSAAKLWETMTVIGLIGAGGLSGVLLIYRRARSRVATLGLIRESLLAAQAGATSQDGLSLRPDMGPEAAAWNQLILEIQSLRSAGVVERVKGSLGTRQQGTNDIEQACDALSVGMIMLDEQARVKHANGAAAALLQIKRDQIVGRAIAELINEPAILETVSAISAGSGQRRTVEIQRTEDQGGGILRLHVRPLRREDSGGALVTIDDVTQQRIADAARNTFVAQATHELRTPLTNMRLCLENALDEKETDPKTLREHFNVLNHETRRLERMVGEMLSVAEIEAGSLQLKQDDVRLDKVFEELQADYKPQAADKQITLAFDLPPKYPVILGDRDKLMVSLHNLLGNALKYTPAGGRVTVTVNATQSMLSVEVSDTGIGIKPDQQQKIFEKFYRCDDPRIAAITGTGLGLALAREIARLHRGDITVQSDLDKGSTFTLTVPIATNTAAKAA